MEHHHTAQHEPSPPHAAACPTCAAGRLAISCGCEFEAKQFEAAADAAPSPPHAEHRGHAGAHEHGAAVSDPAAARSMEADMRRRFFGALVLTVPIVAYSPLGASLLGRTLPTPIPASWLLFLLTTPVVFWAGAIFLTGTWRSLRARKLNMAVLIATGVLTAYLFSVVLLVTRGGESFFDAAAMLVTFVLFGHWMEMRSRRGTSDALRALFDLIPPRARVLRGDAEQEIPSAEIVLGDTVVLRPGDKVPVDGEITRGETAVDEALVTGESLPVTKGVGDALIGGSVNTTGRVEMRATQVGAETVLGQIIRLVETAQRSKAPGQRIADRAAAILVLVALGAGVVAFLAWYVIADAPLLVALTFAVSAIVIACPDALGLATPTAVAVATGVGARHNILIKDAATLENTARISAIVIDKTGTLTEGKPRVTTVASFAGATDAETLAIAAGVEGGSNHPLAQAILAEAARRGISPAPVEAFESLAGKGVRAMLAGDEVLAGTPALLAEQGVNVNGAIAALGDTRGKSLVLIARAKRFIGAIAAADAPRPSARQAVDTLRALAIEVVMLTGDRKEAAEAVAQSLGIDRVFAEVLPEHKAQHVATLQREGRFVAMVGDGINDAPALAQADIGIAIGAGTDVAIETGDIVLMRSDPADIVRAIRLSKATRRKMKQNLFWAAIYNVLAIPVAAGAFYTTLGWMLRPEAAALLMSASSIIVATNAVLLRRVDLTRV